MSHKTSRKPEKRIAMNAKELRSAIKTLGWSQAELGRRVDAYPTTVSRWMTTDRVPGGVAAYVNLFLKVRELAEVTSQAPKRSA